jgi:hypothetical protein
MVEAAFGGGMEHQTCTLMAEAIVNDPARVYEWITAHELAHQWFGDLVTMLDWRHIWLNEGFATYFDALWFEDYYGAATFASRMAGNENTVINYQNGALNLDHPVVDPPTTHTFSTIVYRKGAWVLHMLREVVGKPVFDAAVTNYLNAHAFGNASTDDFIAAVEAAYGQDLDWFWTPWLYGTGRADLQYVAIFSPEPSGWLVQLDVRQVQASPTVFRLPLEVKITTAGGDVLVTTWIEDAHEVLAIPVAQEPLSVQLDPSNKILGTVTAGSTLAAGDPSPPPVRLAAWPNPFTHRLYLAGAADGPLPRDLRVYDVRGRLVRDLGSMDVPGAEIAWDGADASGRRVPPGVYFVRAANLPDAVRVVALAGR